MVGVACAGAARRATLGPWGLGRGMPPGAGVAAVHRFGGTGTAPTSHLWGARGGGLQARLCPRHDGGQLGDGALTATSAASRGDVDRGTGPEASNFGFRRLPLLRPPPPPETEVHLLCDCPWWQTQRAAWLLLVQAEAAQLPALALPSVWQVCLHVTGLLPAALVRPKEVDQAGRLMYRLYGMYLAVLSAHLGAEVETRARFPRSLLSRADTLPMRGGATPGDNWARAHIRRRHQRRRWLCAPARRRGGHGRRPSRWRSCSGPADCGGYQGTTT